MLERLRTKFKIPLIGRTKRFAAVDFDSRKLRVAVADVTPTRTRISSLTTRDIPDSIETSDPQALGEFLRQTLKDMGFRGTSVVMNVPRSQVVLKPLTLPPNTPKNELAGMVYYQVEKELPFPAADAVIDFTVETDYEPTITETDTDETQEQTTDPHRIDVLVAAVRLSVVDHYRRLAEAAHVKLLQLGLRPYADMRCLEVCDPRTANQNLALVHITTDETEIDVVSGRSLVFTRSAVKDISDAGSERPQGVSENVKALAAEVARTLQSYQAIEGGVKIDAVLLAGGTGVERAVAEQLTNTLRVPCEILEVGRAFEAYREGPIDSQFVTVLGTAVAHPSDDELPFDFLNPKRPPVRHDVRKIRAAIIASAVGLLLLVGFVTRSLYLGAKRDQVNLLLKEQKNLEKTIKSLKDTADRVLLIEEWAIAPNWLEHWAHLSCVFPSAKDVYLNRLTTNTDGSTTLSIRARNSEAIAALSERLSGAGYRFRPGSSSPTRDRYGYTSTTTLKILPAPQMKIDLATTRPVARPEDDTPSEEYWRRGEPTPRRPRRPRTPSKPRASAYPVSSPEQEGPSRHRTSLTRREVIPETPLSLHRPPFVKVNAQERQRGAEL